MKNTIITCILTLLIITFMRIIFFPILVIGGDFLIYLGGDIKMTLLFIEYARWGFYLFAVVALLILLSTIYRKTHNTNIYDFNE